MHNVIGGGLGRDARQWATKPPTFPIPRICIRPEIPSCPGSADRSCESCVVDMSRLGISRRKLNLVWRHISHSVVFNGRRPSMYCISRLRRINSERIDSLPVGVGASQVCVRRRVPSRAIGRISRIAVVEVAARGLKLDGVVWTKPRNSRLLSVQNQIGNSDRPTHRPIFLIPSYCRPQSFHLHLQHLQHGGI